MIACANVVRYLNAKPVLVDSELSTWNIDPGKIEEKITNRSRAIMVVHIYGHPANMEPIMKVAKKYGLYVIEDAAEAHGAEYKGRKVGDIGDIGCFSFYANKIITTGEGGIVTTNDDEIAIRIRMLRDQGYYTLLASRIVGAKGKVYAFEPEPTSFKILVRNIYMNQCLNAYPVNKAILDKASKAEFYISKYHDRSSLYDRHKFLQKAIVDTVSLDKFLRLKGKEVTW